MTYYIQLATTKAPLLIDWGALFNTVDQPFFMMFEFCANTGNQNVLSVLETTIKLEENLI